jgi:4-coumarate--CoA ligase (photoactive yellow protein activation family)
VQGASTVIATATAVRTWHDQSGALARFISDLVTDELARLRPGASLALPSRPWPATLQLDEDGLGLDSLDRMAVAAALTEALHLHESGIEDLLLAQRCFGEWIETAAESLRRFDAALTFRTSGSTGTPKPCRHPLAALQHEVEALAGLPPLRGTVGRVLAAVPSHHIYGFLFTQLLPARLGAAETIDVRGLTAPSLRHQLRKGDLVIAHPAFWRLFAQHGRGAPLPQGVRGVSSTAPCPDALAQGLVDQGLESLLQIYGSSETAGIGWRVGAASPFALLPHWQRADAEASAAPGNLLRRGPGGPFAPVVLQDHLDWLDARLFTVGGRTDAAVQVGGVNVFPSQVRLCLCDHPAVADAAVRLMAPNEGDRLKAFVVPHPRTTTDLQALYAELDAWVRTRLPAPARPRAIEFGLALPVDNHGKACDWSIGERFSASGG